LSAEENKALARRAFEEGWNQGNVAVFDELNAPNFIYHDPGQPQVHTHEDLKQWATEGFRVYPDLHLTIEDMVAEGDQVVVRSTFRGTNTGDFVTPMPMPATGKQVTSSGITILRFAGGKIVEVWNQGDNLGVFQQLGVITAPGQAS
jgi:steroid delta-isomerase-like uncharacterized protein